MSVKNEPSAFLPKGFLDAVESGFAPFRHQQERLQKWRDELDPIRAQLEQSVPLPPRNNPIRVLGNIALQTRAARELRTHDRELVRPNGPSPHLLRWARTNGASLRREAELLRLIADRRSEIRVAVDEVVDTAFASFLPNHRADLRQLGVDFALFQDSYGVQSSSVENTLVLPEFHSGAQRFERTAILRQLFGLNGQSSDGIGLASSFDAERALTNTHDPVLNSHLPQWRAARELRLTELDEGIRAIPYGATRIGGKTGTMHPDDPASRTAVSSRDVRQFFDMTLAARNLVLARGLETASESLT